MENGSGFGDKELAGNYLNALRRRAGHTDRISLTLESVLKERRVEMAFEGKRFWDMNRRRNSILSSAIIEFVKLWCRCLTCVVQSLNMSLQG